MPSLARRQSQFARAILDPGLAAPAGLAGPPHAVREERFAVYRNNVAVGLIEALRSAFPVVNQLVGEEFFGAMARLHAWRCPPTSPVLLAYGSHFPAFIAAFAPVAGLPYLADVARLEWLWLEAYHAEDRASIAIEDLQRVPVDSLPGLRLISHPAVRYAHFTHSALAIWRAHQGGVPAPLELEGMSERVLLVRPDAHVEVVAVSVGVFAFMEVVERGNTIADGVSAALAAEPAVAVAEMLSLLFGSGAFCGFVAE